MVVEIHGADELQTQEQRLSVDAIYDAVRELVHYRATSPKKAIVQLQSSVHTSYERYIQVQDAIRAAYHQLWEERAQQQFGLAYKQLEKAAQCSIRAQLPFVLAESQTETTVVQ